jgi:hypothetical protein
MLHNEALIKKRYNASLLKRVVIRRFAPTTDRDNCHCHMQQCLRLHGIGS